MIIAQQSRSRARSGIRGGTRSACSFGSASAAAALRLPQQHQLQQGQQLQHGFEQHPQPQHCLPAAVPALALALASTVAAPALVAVAAAALQAGGFAGVLQERFQGLLLPVLEFRYE
jgi:hypothetical protein